MNKLNFKPISDPKDAVFLMHTVDDDRLLDYLINHFSHVFTHFSFDDKDDVKNINILENRIKKITDSGLRDYLLFKVARLIG